MSTEDPTTCASSASVDAQFSSMKEPSGYVFWPKALLPSIVGNVKVYSFGYDADVERFMSSAGFNTVKPPAWYIPL
jgi:hypothetical protein